ncbi:MAG: AAA family ATPase, partial [Polyangiaceae bacterium]
MKVAHVAPPPAAPRAPVVAIDPPKSAIGAHGAPASIAPAPSVSTPITVRSGMTLRGPKKIAVFNHKGGTGKTTTSVSVAAGLAAR